MKKIIYSLLAMLMVACGVECSAQTVSGSKDGHDYVDLGLPSGRLWATYNVGASKPTEYGYYFAWGETKPKEKYDWSTYKWIDVSFETLTKYCLDSDNEEVDSLTTLLAEDDAATANWGAGWRMPTTTEQQELRDGCDWKWTDDFNGSGVAGRIGTSKTNGSTIFLPAAGIHYGTDFNGDGGFYWSSSLYENSSSGSYRAYYFNFDSDILALTRYHRNNGKSVRAVVK